MTQPAILITVDSLRKDILGREASTPALQSLVDDPETATHYRYWAAGCETGSNSKVLLSGQPGYEYGSPYSGGLDPRRAYLPELLPEEVTTIAVTTNVWLTREYGWERGWDHFEDFHGDDSGGGEETSHGFWRLRRRLADVVSRLPVGETATHTAYRLYGQLARSLPFTHYSTVVDRLAGILSEVTPPVFVWVHLMEPHTPWLPIDGDAGYGKGSVAFAHGRLETDQQFLSKSQRAMLRDLYTRRVEAADRAVGGVLDAVRNRGLFEDALTLVTADHGESLGEHGWFGHGHLGMPKQLYPELVNLPMVVRAPDETVDHSVAGHVDVVPTVLDWFGESQEFKTGRSLLESHETQNRLRWCEYDHPPDQREGVACTDGQWLYIRTKKPGTTDEELYNVSEDPFAKHPIEDRPDLIERFGPLAEERLANRDGRHEETTTSENVEERLADLGYR